LRSRNVFSHCCPVEKIPMVAPAKLIQPQRATENKSL
jgi:hypothetical protein